MYVPMFECLLVRCVLVFVCVRMRSRACSCVLVGACACLCMLIALGLLALGLLVLGLLALGHLELGHLALGLLTIGPLDAPHSVCACTMGFYLSKILIAGVHECSGRSGLARLGRQGWWIAE